ncbi:hypothetical protein WA158_007228 [Blastocystis sp. Blastoise]
MSLPTCDPTFFQFVDSLRSVDNDVRKAAEDQFKTLQEQDAYGLIIQFLGCYFSSENGTVRAYCAIMLKKLTTLLTWSKFDATQQKTICDLLLHAFQNETDANARHQVSNIIAPVSGLTKEWPELLPCLNSACTHSDPLVQCEGIYILGEMSDYSLEVIQPIINDIHTVFKQCISGQNPQVKFAAAKATLTFLLCLNEEKFNPFVSQIPVVLQVIKGLLEIGNEEDAQQLLISLGDICRLNVVLLNQWVPGISSCMIQIASLPVSVETVKQALEVLIAISETNSTYLRKNMNALSNIVGCLLHHMCIIDDDDTWEQGIYGDEEEMSNSLDTNYLMASSILERLCLNVRGANIYREVTKNLKGLIMNKDWKQRRAAYSAIWCIADGCSKNIEKDLGTWVNYIITGLNDVHPRVVFAALFALGGLEISLQPKIQKEFGSMILESLMGLIQKNPCMRIQGHIASCLLSFFSVDKLGKNIYKRYLDTIMNFLVTLCGINQPDLQTEAVGAINAISSITKSAFAPYYAPIILGLKGICDSDLTDSNLDLHKNCYDCISSILLNMGKDKVSQEANEIELYMCNKLFSLPETDLRVPILLDTVSSIYDCINQNRDQLLSQLIPCILKFASIEIEVSATPILNENDVVEQEGYENYQVELKNIGTLNISSNTASMELKYYALGALYKFIESSNSEILPYLDSIYQVVSPLIQFKFYSAVRSLSAELIGLLLSRYIDINNKNNTLNIEMITGMVHSVLTMLVTQYADEAEEEDQEGIADAISVILKACLETGNDQNGTYIDSKIHLPLEYNQELMDSFVSYLRDCVSAITSYYEDIDKEDREEQEQLDELEDDISILKENLEHLIDSLGYIIKLENIRVMNEYNTLVLPMADEFMSNKLGLIQFVGLCPIDDFFEYCSTDLIAPLVPRYLPFMLKNGSNVDPFLRQASLYGLKVLVDKHSQLVSTQVAAIVKSLYNSISSRDSSDEMYASCTDNALSALLAVLLRFGNTFDDQLYKQMCGVIIDYVPAVNDVIESKSIHRTFAQEVMKQKEGIFNSNDLYKRALSKLPSLLVPNFADADDEDEEAMIADKETQVAVVNYLKQLPNGYNGLLNNYGPEEKKWISKKMNSL